MPTSHVTTRLEIAFHEAGHAVIAAELGFLPDTVSLVGDEQMAGYSGHAALSGPGIMEQIVVSYAGYAAHIRHAPDANERALAGARMDFQTAARLLRILDPADSQGPSLEAYFRGEADRLVAEHWGKICRVAHALLHSTKLGGAELRTLLEPDR